MSRCTKNDVSVRILGDVLQLLNSQQLSCSAIVSTDSAMGSMMQHLRGSCSTNEAVTVAESWEVVQEATT